jgi:hypothetical protein
MSVARTDVRLRQVVLAIFSGNGATGDREGLDRFLPDDRTTYCAYGRQALTLGLERLGIGPGDLVLVPGFVCRELLGAVRVVGADVRFYDVDEELRIVPHSLDRRGGAGTVRAVVVVNYFGFPQRLDDVAAWCRTRGASLIEDNAHGFLSADDEVPLGRRGDFGIFSLRKTLALPNGAALVDNRIDAPVRPGRIAFDGSCGRSNMRWYAKWAARRVIALGGRPIMRSLLGSVRLLRHAATGSSVPTSTAESEFTIPLERLSAHTAHALRRFAPQTEVDRRRTLFEQCRALLAGAAEIRPLFAELPRGVVPQGFPFLYRGEQPDRFVEEWWRKGLPIVRWPELPAAIAASAPPHYRRVMVVPFLW